MSTSERPHSFQVTASYGGKRVGKAIDVSLYWPSKTGLVSWMFDVCSILKKRGSSVVDSGASRAPGPAFTPAGSSPVVPLIPPNLLNQPPFYFAGQTGKGGSSGSVSTLVSAPRKGVDMAWSTPDGAVVTSPGPTYVVSWRDERSGIALPRWRSIIRSGGNATTPLNGVRSSIAGSPGSMVVTYRQGGSLLWRAAAGVISQATPVDVSVAGFVQQVDARALSKLHERLWDIEHDARLGESLGELRQSLAMIGKPFQGMRDLILATENRAIRIRLDAARRFGRPESWSPSEIREVTRALASLFLEFNFGWKPLALDMLSAVAACEKARNSVATKLSVSFKDDAVASDTSFSDIYNSYCYFITRVVDRESVSVRYQVGINPEAVAVLSYLERVGITPREFIPTIYAILPYSWLLDYFTGLNACVDALCADLRFVTWTCRTLRRTSKRDIVSVVDAAKAKSALGANYVDASGKPSSSWSAKTVVQRSVPSTLIPSPVLRIPKSWKPWLNITALMLQKKIALAAGRVIPTA